MRIGMVTMTAMVLATCPCTAQEAGEPPVWSGGSLLLCGGGKLTDEVLDRFYTLGGGTRGRLVLIPTASPRSDLGDNTPWLPIWEGYSWSEIRVVHLEDRSQADSPSHSEILGKATAVWIGGGDQTRLSERLVGTRIEEELKGLLERGGVLGGTSAGAAICSRMMIREGKSKPLMGTGFSILTDVIIDQHFSAKRRQERLSRATLEHPKLAGLGIDEGTGILFCNGGMEILGEGEVHWYRAGDADAETGHEADIRWNSGDRVRWSDVVRTGQPSQAPP